MTTLTREQILAIPAEDGGPGERRSRPWLFYTVLGLLTLVFIAPLIYMAVTSFKTPEDAISTTPQWWPANPTTQAYDRVLNDPATPVGRWFLNSMIAATANSLLAVSTATLAGYALARIPFKGRQPLFVLIVATLFLPPVVLLVPNYLTLNFLGWLDTLLVVIIPGAAGAFGVFFMRQFFIGLPKELEESASLDGATRWKTFLTVLLPLARPAIATLILLTFLTNWNDFLWPIYTLFSPDKQTLPAGLSTLQSANSVRYDLLMAGAMISAVPVLLLYAFTQRFIVEGIASAGMKD
ncbi:carbohydrate ABC transporter permease [Actinoplanes sp. NPDC023714]|uniref:carbohydrate ABC transporter permease n=1 Tax=Actinoplanes sp. NPDC023714 TaxID=3154322 RepID=UPI0033ED7F94